MRRECELKNSLLCSGYKSILSNSLKFTGTRFGYNSQSFIFRQWEWMVLVCHCFHYHELIPFDCLDKSQNSLNFSAYSINVNVSCDPNMLNNTDFFIVKQYFCMKMNFTISTDLTVRLIYIDILYVVLRV